MKKPLLAPAALCALATFTALGALSGAANAQSSSVTVYGIIDLGIAKGNGGKAFSFGAPTDSGWGMQQAASSRLGFRGNEDLGGGLSAQFMLDHRFTPDTGAATVADRFWHGQSWVRLSNKGIGSLTLGRQIIPLYWVVSRADPWDWTGLASPGNAQLAGFSTQGAGNAFRMSDAVAFRSADFGGFTVEAMVGASQAGLGRNESFSIVYRKGPLYAGLAYAGINGGNAATVDGNRLITATAAYKFGNVDLMANYGEAKVNGGRLNNQTANLAAQIDMGASTVKLAYAWTDINGANNTRKKIGLGYEYALSKRTNLYSNAGIATEDKKTNNTAYQVGIKHLF